MHPVYGRDDISSQLELEDERAASFVLPTDRRENVLALRRRRRLLIEVDRERERGRERSSVESVPSKNEDASELFIPIFSEVKHRAMRPRKIYSERHRMRPTPF